MTRIDTRRRHGITVALLLLACLLTFLPGLHGPFLHDDYANLKLANVGDPGWQAAWDVAFRNSSGPFGRPLANLSFAANYWWLGSEPFHFKLVNLCLHALCGLLVYALSRRLMLLLRNPPDETTRHIAALATMALWVLHPLQVSTTLYAVQRMAQLSALFVLAGCLWFVTKLQASPRPGHPIMHAGVTCAGIALCLLLGFAGKESAVLLPAFLGVIALLARTQGTLPRNTETRVVLALCVALPLLAGLMAFLAAPHEVLADYAKREFTLPERLLTESVVLWFYLRLILLPWIPAMGLFHDDFPIYDIGDWEGWLAVAAWVAAVMGAWRFRHRWPLACFALLWFLAAHQLESTFVPLELVYEHRNYIALLGPALWAGSMSASLIRRFPALRIGWLIPALLLGAATMARSHQWSSADLFSIYEYRHHPHSIRAMFGEAGREIVTRDYNGASKLYRGIQQEAERRQPGQAWPLMLDALLQCRMQDHPVQWDELRVRMERNRTLDRTLEFSSAIMSQLMPGNCRWLELGEFRDTLATAYRVSMRRHDAEWAELAASHLGWSGAARHEAAFQRLWLQRAADANPRAVEPLFDLAYFNLNAGQLDEAAGRIEELRARTAQYSLPVGYRIDYLEKQLQDAESKQHADAATSSH